MGTNYYLHRNSCEHCGRGDEPLHIGKSSAGWCFSLRVYPLEDWDDEDDEPQGPRNLAEWKALFAEDGVRIIDEYNEAVTPADMLSRITDRGREQWTESAQAQLQYGSCERGPNNLLRHSLRRNCIGHGDGPWDLIVGEFS